MENIEENGYVLHVRVSREQREIAERQAKRMGLAVSSWIRYRCFAVESQASEPAVAAVRELSRDDSDSQLGDRERLALMSPSERAEALRKALLANPKLAGSVKRLTGGVE